MTPAEAPGAIIRSSDLVVPGVKEKRWPKAWAFSAAALLGAQALDSASSWNRPELNPLLANSRGQFGAQSALIKVGAVGTLLAIEALIVRGHPKAARFFTFLNWSAGGVTAGAAAYNYSID